MAQGNTHEAQTRISQHTVHHILSHKKSFFGEKKKGNTHEAQKRIAQHTVHHNKGGDLNKAVLKVGGVNVAKNAQSKV